MTRPLQPLPAPPARSFPDPGLVGAYDALLERYMPPAILINERRELLHVFGDIDRFLRVKRGRPSLDVLETLDPDLRTAIAGALQRVIKEGQPVRYSGIRARTERGEEVLDLAVEPVDNQRSRAAQILILIRETVRPRIAPPPAVDGDGSSDNQQISRDRIDALETELRFTKENLQATIEELETSNEEMQATNEELVASNEELQSTNEELQSVNEELFTVNAEYQRKISELSEMTADMDNLLESTDIGTIFLDENLQIRKFTPQIGQAFHLLPQDVGRPIESFSHSILHTGLIEDLQRVRSTHEPCYREVRDQNGKDLYLRILPYRTKTKYDGIVVTLVDVSLLKAAERRLADAVRLRDEFLAMLSHELRNPLGAIQSAAQLMSLKPNLDEDLRDARDVVHRQGTHLARLLDDLLDVSRVTQRKIELRRRPVALDTIIGDAVETVKPLYEAGELKFTADRAAAQQVVVEADSVRLQQAISNVLANAAKYTPRGGSVSLKAEAGPDEVVLTVCDTGVGIEPDKLESIFDLFVQSDQSLHRSKGGMGIGLTLARSIIELHQGTIVARSEGSGKGSEFEIRLPRLAQRAPAPEKEAQPAKPRECFDCTVVIVEDGDDSRLMLKMLLESQGCRVLAAENGLKGLALIEQGQPDVAIVDIGLPGLSGYDVARQIRAGTPGTAPYLVALTGYGRASDVQKALDAGFDTHLVKPLDLSKLTRILEFQSRRTDAVK